MTATSRAAFPRSSNGLVWQKCHNVRFMVFRRAALWRSPKVPMPPRDARNAFDRVGASDQRGGPLTLGGRRPSIAGCARPRVRLEQLPMTSQSSATRSMRNSRSAASPTENVAGRDPVVEATPGRALRRGSLTQLHGVRVDQAAADPGGGLEEREGLRRVGVPQQPDAHLPTG
jgi:hypothetical protein